MKIAFGRVESLAVPLLRWLTLWIACILVVYSLLCDASYAFDLRYVTNIYYLFPIKKKYVAISCWHYQTLPVDTLAVSVCLLRF